MTTTKTVKLDLTKADKAYYAATQTPKLLDLGQLPYVCIRGKGAPAGPGFEEGIGALYGVAYGLKFARKAVGEDFTVPKLECLWVVPEGEEAADEQMESWEWQLLIRMPDAVTAAMVAEAKEGAVAKAAKAKRGPGRIMDVDYLVLEEGRCAQVMHVGPYPEEKHTVVALKEWLKGEGYRVNGAHHEVYISDPRRTAPERLKTIIRYPVVEA